MSLYLSWSTVEADMDEVEKGDRAGIVSVYLTYKGAVLEELSATGRQQRVNISSFASHFNIPYHHLHSWIETFARMPA